ncbi:MAG: hypothetical protein IKW67_03405 [Alphaproteobacteria bacterium]|nr:hypothetical protein [Alphaproteobacteria bacterium]
MSKRQEKIPTIDIITIVEANPITGVKYGIKKVPMVQINKINEKQR